MLTYLKDNDKYILKQENKIFKNHKLLILISSEDNQYMIDIIIKNKCLLRLLLTSVENELQYTVVGISMLDTIDLHDAKLDDSFRLKFLQSILKECQAEIDTENIVNNTDILFKRHYLPTLNNRFVTIKNVPYSDFVQQLSKYRYLSNMHKNNLLTACEHINKFLTC